MSSSPVLPLTITLSATGHRPNKLGGFNTVTDIRLAKTAQAAVLHIQQTHIIAKVISGMALGWDLAIARATLDLNLPLICAIPCPQQTKNWPPHYIAIWADIKRAATETHIISQSYSPEAMQQRNVWMVDNCDLLLALYKGGKGGTKNCLNYAAQTGKPHINFWPQYRQELL